MAMVFIRPASAPVPQVWVRFSAERDGETLRFIVRDALPAERERILAHMSTTFLAQEPLCHSLGIPNDAVAKAALVEDWAKILGEQTTLACVTDDELQGLVAMNLCYVQEMRSPDKRTVESAAYNHVFDIIGALVREADVFRSLPCERYLAALGLLVLPEFRGLGLGTRMLQAREPLCRALGLRATVTPFSSAAAQRAASAAGMHVLSERRSDEMPPAVARSPPFIVQLMGRTYHF